MPHHAARDQGIWRVSWEPKTEDYCGKVGVSHHPHDLISKRAEKIGPTGTERDKA